MTERPAMTKVKCPRCGSRDLSLSEHVYGTTTFDVIAGALDREAGVHEVEGVKGVSAHCSRCAHSWRVRSAVQITDIVVELASPLPA